MSHWQILRTKIIIFEKKWTSDPQSLQDGLTRVTIRSNNFYDHIDSRLQDEMSIPWNHRFWSAGPTSRLDSQQEGSSSWMTATDVDSFQLSYSMYRECVSDNLRRHQSMQSWDHVCPLYDGFVNIFHDQHLINNFVYFFGRRSVTEILIFVLSALLTSRTIFLKFSWPLSFLIFPH